jgi:hypothetical protein
MMFHVSWVLPVVHAVPAEGRRLAGQVGERDAQVNDSLSSRFAWPVTKAAEAPRAGSGRAAGRVLATQIQPNPDVHQQARDCVEEYRPLVRKYCGEQIAENGG